LPGTASAQHASCVAECQAVLPHLPDACNPLFEDLLSCLTCATVRCPQMTCEGDVCVSEGTRLLGCENREAAFQPCAPCLSAPITQFEGGSAGVDSIRTTTSRCACPAALEDGAPPGAPCNVATDCAQACCGCPDTFSRFVIQACRGGVCVGAPEICALGC